MNPKHPGRRGFIGRAARAAGPAGTVAAVLLLSLAWCSAATAQPSDAPASTDTPEVMQWSAGDEASVDRGLQLLSAADGKPELGRTKDGEPFASPEAASGGKTFLYFGVGDGFRPDPSSPVYVRVEYLDAGLGGGVTLQYDGANGDPAADDAGSVYQPAEDRAGGWQVGSGEWRTVAFELRRPRFEGRQNEQADFRLSGDRLVVRAVSLTRDRPGDYEQLAAPPVVEPVVRVGPGFEFIIGGFDIADGRDPWERVRELEAAAPALRALGVTSVETYVRWSYCEPEEGRYDWALYDGYRDACERAGLKWVPFLIVGSPYSLPDWYYKSESSQGYVCLEHGLESDVESLWNPVVRGHVSRFLEAFSGQYGDDDALESILLGITGNYGESIYPASGNDWTADAHGEYHTHGGYWAGDPYAVESFRASLRAKYGTDDAWRAAWGEAAGGAGGTIDAVVPRLRGDTPGDRAWLDFVEWYAQAMTDYTDFWLVETRKHYAGELYVCTGGDARPEHGADFAAQARLAASHDAGIRITNEASDYTTNFFVTRWVASACLQYGTYFTFEPAGKVGRRALMARAYNATASGARGMHAYLNNTLVDPPTLASFARAAGHLRRTNPVTEIAVFYPETHVRLFGQDLSAHFRPLRDRFDFAYMSGGQIHDGGLAGVKALVIAWGTTAEASTWREIAEWVRGGGVLVFTDGMGPLRSVGGDTDISDEILKGDPGLGRIAVEQNGGDEMAYRDFVTRTLRDCEQLSPQTRRMVAADGREDGVYVTLTDEALLWYNLTAGPVDVGVSLPPGSMVTQALEPSPTTAP